MSIGLGGGEDEPAEVHEINVTPFIDVMLVLLIIFMVAAPLATVDVPVDLPSSTAAAQPRPDRPVFLTVKADRTLVLDDAPVAIEGLGAALDRLTDGRHDQAVFLRADAAVPYGEMMRVMDALRAGGYLKVALVAADAVQVGK